MLLDDALPNSTTAASSGCLTRKAMPTPGDLKLRVDDHLARATPRRHRRRVRRRFPTPLRSCAVAALAAATVSASIVRLVDPSSQWRGPPIDGDVGDDYARNAEFRIFEALAHPLHDDRAIRARGCATAISWRSPVNVSDRQSDRTAGSAEQNPCRD